MSDETPGQGHNSSAGLQETIANSAGKRLRSFIERVERLEEEKKAIADDIKEVFAEAKGEGYDVKALRAVLKYRKQDPAERAEQEALVDTYLSALGEA